MARAWCEGNATVPFALTVNELVELTGVLNHYESSAQSKSEVRDMAKLGAKMALWRNRRVRPHAGANPVARWCSPGLRRGHGVTAGNKRVTPIAHVFLGLLPMLPMLPVSCVIAHEA